MSIGYDAFKTFCKGLNGHTLRTLSSDAEFQFNVEEAPKFRFCFTPLSTGGVRSVAAKHVEWYVNEFNANGGSLRPVDYPKHVNASYMVTLFKRYQDSLNNPSSEIIFEVQESPEGGYEARALGYSIYSQAADWEQLKETLRDAVRCHFDEWEWPRLIRLHLVRDEVIPV